jgi:hypothetical protein
LGFGGLPEIERNAGIIEAFHRRRHGVAARMLTKARGCASAKSC